MWIFLGTAQLAEIQGRLRQGKVWAKDAASWESELCMLKNIVCERINEYNILYLRNSEYSRLHLIKKAKQVKILKDIVSKVKIVCLQLKENLH